jgi:hypothetical protein
MIRLLVHVEGQTEEAFVNEVLCEHLISVGYRNVAARIAGNPRKQRGGVRPWPGIRRDISRHLKEDHTSIHAVMMDYYGLPAEWPGRAEASTKGSVSAKAEHVEAALLANIAEGAGSGFDAWRFIPLIMMHEFEAMLFSDPDRFAQEIGRASLSGSFRAIRDEFQSPEDINDSAETAPSKRIQRLFPGYEKPLFGVLAVMGIGLATIRQECPHFNNWLERLESLPAQFTRNIGS